MKKSFFALIAFATMILAISAQALEPRLTEARPTLRFDGTTAYCSVICYGESSNDTVDVTLTLYQGTSYVDSWSGSGKGRASLSGSCEVSSGKSYKLVLNYSVNGKTQPSVSTTKTCP